MIGPYKLIEEIGEGGMGSVFMALQKEPVRRRVALKLIKLGLETKQVLARFEDRTRLLLEPVTGRSHQLRIHLRELGHPILGCDMYAHEQALAMAGRLMLHATTLAFEHPTSGDWLEGVDWERTKAFSLGLTGLFLNRKGREAKGIVEKGAELDALCAEIKGKLLAPDGAPVVEARLRLSARPRWNQFSAGPTGRRFDLEGRSTADGSFSFQNLPPGPVELGISLDRIGMVTWDRRIQVQAGENLAGSEVWVRVRDNGPGIDPARMQKVFSPFYTSKSSGTGLGLYICRLIVEGHGGQIWVDSFPGAGTSFSVFFPECGEALEDEAPGPTARVEAQGLEHQRHRGAHQSRHRHGRHEREPEGHAENAEVEWDVPPRIEHLVGDDVGISGEGKNRRNVPYVHGVLPRRLTEPHRRTPHSIPLGARP